MFVTESVSETVSANDNNNTDTSNTHSNSSINASELKKRHVDQLYKKLTTKNKQQPYMRNGASADKDQQEEKNESDETAEETNTIRFIKFLLQFTLWSTLLAIFVKLEFGVVYIVVSSLVLLYLNTNIGKRKGVSAYSVFNPNVERLPGQLTAEQLEKSLIRGF